MRTSPVLRIAVPSLLLLTACFGKSPTEAIIENAADGNAEVNVEGDTINVTTSEGTATFGNKVPADWPEDAPIYANATVTYSASVNPQTGEDGLALVLTTADTKASVKEFYANEWKKQGWTIESNMDSGGMLIVSAKKDTRRMSLMIASAEGQTTITTAVENDAD